jgi:hypothetical protein
VALKIYVDNVCRQVIELIYSKSLLEVFSTEKVALLSDVELDRIAAESPAIIRKQKSCRIYSQI